MKVRAMVICALVFCSATVRGQAQSDQATMQSLLAEVRQLRQALEKIVATGPRMQVALERLRMQDEKVSRLGKDLSDVRRELGGLVSIQTRTAEDVRNHE